MNNADHAIDLRTPAGFGSEFDPGIETAAAEHTGQMLQAVALRHIQGILLARRRAELQLLAAKEALRATNQALRQALEDREKLLASERAARTQAERASVMKDEFLATLSHELRTPLTAILGWSQILMTGRSDAEDTRRGVASIVRNARAQAQLIDELLDMSRIVSGNLRLDVQTLEVRAVALAALDTAAPSAEAKRISLSTEIAADCGVVAGDAHRLQQVFWNLLSNAVKFTPAGGRIDVAVVRSGDSVQFVVRDSGSGIPAAFLPHVFDRFSQADASTTRRYGGLGIGLAIAHHLVELHGGIIEARSDGEGHGATFVVSLPLVGAAGDQQSYLAANGRDPDATAAAGFLGGLRVLVVDDDADSRALVALVLERSGATVLQAPGAEHALQLMAETGPDVLVCDIGMPGMDGYDLVRRLRQSGCARDAGIAAIALSAFTRREDRVRALAAGFHSHLGKPFDPDELVACVGSLVGRVAPAPPAAGAEAH